MTVMAHLNDAAFQTLLIAGIETFPTGFFPTGHGKNKRGGPARTQPGEGEAMGLLFGQRIFKGKDLIFNVALAVPMQTAVRSKDWVVFSDRHFNRIRDVLHAFPTLEFLGSFHSHPWRRHHYRSRMSVAFSRGDERSALSIAEDFKDEVLEMIIGITALKDPSDLTVDTVPGFIAGACGRFQFSLAAYCTVHEKKCKADGKGRRRIAGQLRTVDELHCPLAVHAAALVGRFKTC